MGALLWLRVPPWTGHSGWSEA